MTTTIAIGSKNPVKIAATKFILSQVFSEAEFIGLAVPSNVPDQPWGEDQTREGAYNRAKHVLTEARADYGVGLEGGLIKMPIGLMTCAWCVILSAQGKVGYGGGLHILLPPLISDMLNIHGELGPAMDQLINEENTKQNQGAVGILTNGLVTRQKAYEQLVAMAAAPFVTGFYEA